MKCFLIKDQRDVQILFYVFVSIYNSQYVSSTSCSSSRETNCINDARSTKCKNHDRFVEMNLRSGWI